MSRIAIALAAVVASGGCGNDLAPPDGPGGAATLAAIRSDIFEKSCAFNSCHGGPTPAAKLDLHSDVCSHLVLHASCLFPNKLLVVRGKPEASFLIDKLHGGARLDATPAGSCGDTNLQMPLGGVALSADKVAQVEDWIREGADCGGEVPHDAGVDAPVDAPKGAADVASISATASSIRAGDTVTVTVSLSKPAPPGGQTIDIDVGSTSVLGAPSALHIDAGLATIDFGVMGKRPAHPVTVKATRNGGTISKSLTLGVTGLTVVELLADPAGTDNGLEWIKLSNNTGVAIDLGAYSIGSGRTHYTYSMTQLAGILPAHGCFVVGGPTSSAANGNPSYAQRFNFQPDLLGGSGGDGQATGTALFDVPITALTEASVPLDTVLCGTNNNAGLVGPDGLAATPRCPDVAAGHSVARTGPTTWVDLGTPTPNNCTPI